MPERRLIVNDQEMGHICAGEQVILLRKMRKQPGQDLVIWSGAGWEDGDGRQMNMPYKMGEVLLACEKWRLVPDEEHNCPVTVRGINPERSKGGWYWRIEVQRVEEEKP